MLFPSRSSQECERKPVERKNRKRDATPKTDHIFSHICWLEACRRNQRAMEHGRIKLRVVWSAVRENPNQKEASEEQRAQSVMTSKHVQKRTKHNNIMEDTLAKGVSTLWFRCHIPRKSGCDKWAAGIPSHPFIMLVANRLHDWPTCRASTWLCSKELSSHPLARPPILTKRHSRGVQHFSKPPHPRATAPRHPRSGCASIVHCVFCFFVASGGCGFEWLLAQLDWTG